MAQRLKRWESPRREGRNDKGKGGAARARQLKKRQQMLRKKLQEGQQADDHNNQNNQPKGRENNPLPLFFCMIPNPACIPPFSVTHTTRRDVPPERFYNS